MSLILPTDPGLIRNGPAAEPTDISRFWPWCMLALCGLVSAVLMARAELTIVPWSPSNFPYYAAATLVLTLKARRVQRMLPYGKAIADAGTYFLLFTAIALMGAATSYPIAAMSHGYADATLQRIDGMLGFDWLAWYRLVAAHPFLQWLGIGAYESIYVTPAVLLGWFAFHDERAAANRFLASFWLAAAITLALFSLMPAVGPFAYLWHGPIPYMPRSELWQPDLIPQLRAHAVHIIDLGQLRGLVSAPSFHAAAAAIYLVTAWRIPPLRWVLVPLNGAMLLATPVEGTHYLADIILGIGVAAGAMAVGSLLIQTPRRAGGAQPRQSRTADSSSWGRKGLAR